MLNKLTKFEEKLNDLISRLKIWIIAFLAKLIPAPLKRYYLHIRTKIQFYFLACKTRIFRFVEYLELKTINGKNRIVAILNFIKEYPIKEKIFLLLDKLKTILLKTPLRDHAQVLNTTLKKQIDKIDSIMDKIGKAQLGIAVTVFVLMGIGLSGMYDSSQQLYQNEFPNRTPASVEDYAKRPDYKMYEKKTLKVMNIKVPVFSENIKQVQNITVDFTVRTSTRFAKIYLEYYENQLKDYFFTTVEPVISSFPLEDEGKEVLKEKIQYELNNYLKENQVEGLVEEVNIVFIIGT